MNKPRIPDPALGSLVILARDESAFDPLIYPHVPTSVDEYFRLTADEATQLIGGDVIFVVVDNGRGLEEDRAEEYVSRAWMWKRLDRWTKVMDSSGKMGWILTDHLRPVNLPADP